MWKYKVYMRAWGFGVMWYEWGENDEEYQLYERICIFKLCILYDYDVSKEEYHNSYYNVMY